MKTRKDNLLTLDKFIEDKDQKAILAHEIATLFGNSNQIAIICGQVSGNLEVIDIDDASIFHAFYESCFLHQIGQEASPRLPGGPSPRQDLRHQQGRAALQGPPRLTLQPPFSR